MNNHSIRDGYIERQLDKKFASRGFALILYAPGILALVAAFLYLSIGSHQAANTYILMAVVINLLAGFLDMFRKKIIRQDQAIKALQEQLMEKQSGGRES